MQIIAGEKRGRKLVAPEGLTTRPILQLLKTRLFDILGPRFTDVTVWDVFAGSGSLGLEALSRGAKAALFVEADRDSFKTLEKNIRTLAYEKKAKAVLGDIFRLDPAAFCPEPAVIFLDPPFPIMRETPEMIASLMDGPIRAAIRPDGVVCLRVPAKFEWQAAPRSFVLDDRRDHGEQSLLFYLPGASTDF